MRGLEVKKILTDSGVTLKTVATALGITPQLLNNWLNVDDIKTGILEKIAKVIGKDIYFFIDKRNGDNKNVYSSIKSEKSIEQTHDKPLCELCEQKQRTIDYLKNDIEELRNDKRNLQLLIDSLMKERQEFDLERDRLIDMLQGNGGPQRASSG